MSSSNVALRLYDVIRNADRISAYVGDGDRDLLVHNHLVQDAVERCPERIAEAVVKIGPQQMAEIMPELPFERVRGLGNMLRHAYDSVDLTILFDVVRHDVPRLKSAAQRFLDHHDH